MEVGVGEDKMSHWFNLLPPAGTHLQTPLKRIAFPTIREMIDIELLLSRRFHQHHEALRAPEHIAHTIRSRQLHSQLLGYPLTA